MAEDLNGIFSGETVLIADDDEFFRELLKGLLLFTGLDVVSEVSTGQEALIEFLAYHPKILFLDINMPGINGLDVLSEIRSISPSTIIFVISGETTRENMLKAISGKVNAIIAKPFTFSRVIEEIKKALEQPGGWRKLPRFAAG